MITMCRLSIVLALLGLWPSVAAAQDQRFNTVVTTSTSITSLRVGCAVGVTNCTGGIVAGQLKLATLTPGVTTGVVYTPDGTSLWFGATQLAAGGTLGPGTIGKIGKFTGGTAIGDSILTETSGLITVAGGFQVTTNTGGAVGTVYKTAQYGLTLATVAGSSHQFLLEGTAGDIFKVPIGTQNVVASGALQFDANNSGPGNGAIYKNATYGIIITGVTGASYDFDLINGAFDVLRVPTGTGNVELPQNLKVTGTITAGSGSVGITDSTGKIPAISGTYFASLSGANLTALTAANISAGTAGINISGTAPAGSLTGTTLNATVVTSSLTSVGTIGTGLWEVGSPTTVGFAPGTMYQVIVAAGATDKLAGYFEMQSAVNQSGGPQALEGFVQMTQTGTTALAIGTIGNVQIAGSGIATEVRAVQGGVIFKGVGATGTGTDAKAFAAVMTGQSSSATTVFTNGYGFYVGSFGAGFTNKYSFFSTDSSALLSQAGGGTFGGILTVNGFGSHTFSAGGTGANILAVRNTTAGTGNGGGFQVGNDGAANAGGIFQTSTTYTTLTDLMYVYSTRAGGIFINAEHASGIVRFGSGGGNEAMRIFASGGVSIGSTTDEGAGTLLVASDIWANTKLVSLTATPLQVPNLSADTGTALVLNAGGYVQKLTSAARFKEHIAPWVVSDTALDRYVALSPKLWDYANEPSGAGGFLADDLDALGIENPYGASVLVNYDATGRVESNRDFAIIGMEHFLNQRQEREIAALTAELAHVAHPSRTWLGITFLK